MINSFIIFTFYLLSIAIVFSSFKFFWQIHPLQKYCFKNDHSNVLNVHGMGELQNQL